MVLNRWIRRALFIGLIPTGAFFGIWVGGFLYGWLLSSITKILEWLFPQHVVTRPIDYLGILPWIAAIVVLLLTTVISTAYRRKYNKPSADYARQTFIELVEQGLPKAILSTFVIGCLLGLYVGFGALSVVMVILLF